MAHPTQVAGAQYASILTVSIHVIGCQCRQKAWKIGTRDAAIRSSRIVIRDKPSLSTAAIMIQHANSISSYPTSRLAPTRLDRSPNHPHRPHVALMVTRISMRSHTQHMVHRSLNWLLGSPNVRRLESMSAHRILHLSLAAPCNILTRGVFMASILRNLIRLFLKT